MNLHEYQAKALFRAYGVDTPRSILAKSADEPSRAQELGGSVWVVKRKSTRAGAARRAASKSRKAWTKCASTPAK